MSKGSTSAHGSCGTHGNSSPQGGQGITRLGASKIPFYQVNLYDLAEGDKSFSGIS